MTVGEDVNISYPEININGESDIEGLLTKPSSSIPAPSPVPKKKLMTVEREAKGCCFVSLLAFLLTISAVTTILLFVPYGASPSSFVEVEEVEYGNREFLLGELKGGEGIYYALNLSEIAVPEGVNPSFFSCLHVLTPDLFACVSQSLIPTFDECKRLAEEESEEEYYGEESKGEEVVNKIALIPRCNLGLELSEFGVCNSEELLWISVFSASDDLDRPRTFDLPFSYSDCNECSMSVMDCISNPWLIVSFVISFSFLFCSLCSLFVLFVYANKRKSPSPQ